MKGHRTEMIVSVGFQCFASFTQSAKVMLLPMAVMPFLLAEWLAKWAG